MAERLTVTRDKQAVGRLERVGGEFSTEYRFTYEPGTTPGISLSLPVQAEPFSSSESRPFFDALVPEGSLRDVLAGELRVSANDTFALLGKLGRDCAGALQIVESVKQSEAPDVEWLDDAALAALIVELPRRPLGVSTDGRVRLSLAGAQSKAVLVRDGSGRFGRPLNGMASTHILKPEPANADYAGIAQNEYFCMRLAKNLGMDVADVDLISVADRPCLVVRRFDREEVAGVVKRIHQEDLCQAIGIGPGFKYAAPDRSRPSFKDIRAILDDHGRRPGADRLRAADAAVLNFVIGNADAHGKNISFVHEPDGRVRLAPLYDLVCTAAWPDVDTALAISIGDEFDPEEITTISFADLADDLGLNPTTYGRRVPGQAEKIATAALDLRSAAKAEGWFHPTIDAICDTTSARAQQLNRGSAAT